MRKVCWVELWKLIAVILSTVPCLPKASNSRTAAFHKIVIAQTFYNWVRMTHGVYEVT
jgi:hypothetical protein